MFYLVIKSIYSIRPKKSVSDLHTHPVKRKSNPKGKNVPASGGVKTKSWDELRLALTNCERRFKRMRVRPP